MPWCRACDRFLSPSTVTPDGACPRCGGTVDPGGARAPAPGGPAAVGSTAAPEVVPAYDGEEPREPADATAAARQPAGESADLDDEVAVPLPWHFKLLVAAIVLYLGWRAVQGVEWLVSRL